MFLTKITRIVGVTEGGLNGISQPTVINFFLLEDSSFFLLEDGFKLIL